MHLTVGRNLIDYLGELSTPTANILTSKLLFNSTISTTCALFMIVYLKNFDPKTPMDRYKYMLSPINIIPQEIIEHYNLTTKAKNGFSYMKYGDEFIGFPKTEF